MLVKFFFLYLLPVFLFPVNKDYQKMAISTALPLEEVRSASRSKHEAIVHQPTKFQHDQATRGYVSNNSTNSPGPFFRGGGDIVAPSLQSWVNQTVPNLDMTYGMPIIVAANRYFWLSICCSIWNDGHSKATVSKIDRLISHFFTPPCKITGWAKCPSKFFLQDLGRISYTFDGGCFSAVLETACPVVKKAQHSSTPH